ncbi:uncharacterized protein LOC142355865 [Convolutriloba macropyga]|uniref:uncharacterized protein LOC142355865 n=1 Tax=Convolutriloba macropyga TaxID=536237 RepID=UPI003F522981
MGFGTPSSIGFPARFEMGYPPPLADNKLISGAGAAGMPVGVAADSFQAAAVAQQHHQAVAQQQQQQQLHLMRGGFGTTAQLASHLRQSAVAKEIAVPLQARADVPLVASHLIDKARTHWLKGNELLKLFHLCAEGQFPLSTAAAHQPPSGHLFLYDRRTVRFFRLDGHNWRKKSDGKTVKETHEKLKIDNEDKVNCYYAHAISPASMQRRCYWRLDDDSLVLVHYLEPNSSGSKHWQPTQGLAAAAEPQQLPGRFTMGGTQPPLVDSVPMHPGLGGDKYNISQQKISMAAKSATSGYPAPRHNTEPVSLPWQMYGTAYTQPPFQWQSHADAFALQPSMGVGQSPAWSWDTFATAPVSHPDLLSMHGPLASVQEHASGSGGGTQQAAARAVTVSQSGPSGHAHGRRNVADPRRHSEEVVRRHMAEPGISREHSSAQSQEAGEQLADLDQRAKLGDQSQGWFVIWEVSPEATSTEGGEKILIVGHTSNGFEQHRTVVVDVDGVKCPAQVIKPGVISFISPPHSPGKAKATILGSDGQILSAPASLSFRGPPRRSIQTEFDPWGAPRPGSEPNSHVQVGSIASTDQKMAEDAPRDTQMELIRYLFEKNQDGSTRRPRNMSIN